MSIIDSIIDASVSHLSALNHNVIGNGRIRYISPHVVLRFDESGVRVCRESQHTGELIQDVQYTDNDYMVNLEIAVTLADRVGNYPHHSMAPGVERVRP